MAWRDSRGSHTRLVLAMTAMMIGVAALVAILAFAANVHSAMATQAKVLLGADLVLNSRQPLSADMAALLATVPGEQAREIRCTSMAYFPRSADTRLVQVRALEGDFPYYGTLETEPPAAAQHFRHGLQALVDDSLLWQFDAQVGDSIRLGTVTFEIVGRLLKIPGEAATAALLGPRVYIPLPALAATGLIQPGSLLTYKHYMKLPPESDLTQLLETLAPHLASQRLESETVQKRLASMGRAMTNLSRFLNLTGFIALLLGSLGVASAMHVYMQDKRTTVALLRCLGVQTRQAFLVYLLQAAALGLLGSAGGVLLGSLIQTFLPMLLRDFVPVSLPVRPAWGAYAQGGLLGVWMTLVCALLPLVSIRRVSPLLALRVAADTTPAARDGLRWLLGLLMGLSMVAFALAYTERWAYGLGFCLAIGVAFLLLTATARLLIMLVHAWVPASWPYVWRQGLANLARPQNQTLLLVLTLGFSTFLLLSLALVQQMLVQQVERKGEAQQPNIVFFDIQSDQRDAVVQLVRTFALPVQQQVPLVTMRLSSVKHQSVEVLRNAPGTPIPTWALQWEYRSTYRDTLSATETLVAGTWHGQVSDLDRPIPISLETEIAHTLGVTLGDILVFDLQGVPLTTTVQSLRKVDWQRVQPNFFVVFPPGVLETAPQTVVLVSHVPSNALSAALQRAVVQQFPNVSVIDLRLVLATLDTLLARIVFALRFITLFSLVAGVMLCVSAALTTRTQRVRESVLLRTLGASRRQIGQILTTEYLLLGGLAAVTGVLLAVLASWALSLYLFEAPFTPTVPPLLLTVLAVMGLTVLIGRLSSRGVVQHPPLDVLRDA